MARRKAPSMAVTHGVLVRGPLPHFYTTLSSLVCVLATTLRDFLDLFHTPLSRLVFSWKYASPFLRRGERDRFHSPRLSVLGTSAYRSDSRSDDASFLCRHPASASFRTRT